MARCEYTYHALNTKEYVCHLFCMYQDKLTLFETSSVPNIEVRGGRMIYVICAAIKRAGIVVQSEAAG